VIGGAAAKIFASYRLIDTPLNIAGLLESIFFVIIFAVLFYRKELKILFGDSDKNKK
jgi:hypothetical protein